MALQVMRPQVNSTYFTQADTRTAVHHPELHSHEHIFPRYLLFPVSYLGAVPAGRPGPKKGSTLTLTFQHARLHRAPDAQVQKNTYTPRCPAPLDALACHRVATSPSTGLGGCRGAGT